MNNRYLYRAKHIHVLPCNEHLDGTWVIGYLSGGHYISNEDGEHLIDPATICQCVGLPDKNGKYLYEKDIVKAKDGSMGIVTFGVFGTNNIGFSVKWFYGQHYRHEIGYWAPKVEVIGNAIDNPELLEVGE